MTTVHDHGRGGTRGGRARARAGGQGGHPLLDLQRSAGNRAVAAAVQRAEEEAERTGPVQGAIPQSDFSPAPTAFEDPGELTADRSRGASTTPSRPATAARATAPGPVRIRATDVQTTTTVSHEANPPEESEGDTTFSPTTKTDITAGLNPSPFGSLSRGWRVAVPSFSIQPESGAIDVAVAFTQSAQYGTNGGSNVDVPSASSSEVTADSYPKIVSDLTPKLKELSWVAPRTKYWSQAICERHERFHASDVQKFGDTTGKDFVKKYLDKKSIDLAPTERTDKAVIATKLKKAVEDARDALMVATTEYMRGIGNTYYSYPGEQRAFGDGKQPYLDLVAAVQARGEALAAEKAKAEKAKVDEPKPEPAAVGGP